jgi:AraC-like DNA-binding protein
LLLLQGTESKVIEIALDSGYGSHEAFSRAFRNEFGVSPTQIEAGTFVMTGVEVDIITKGREGW